MEKRMELSNSTYNHFFLENTHFEFCMSTGPHTYQPRNPLPDRSFIRSTNHLFSTSKLSTRLSVGFVHNLNSA